MIYDEREVRQESVLEAAKKIMIAARTAPKGKGVDIIEVMTITGDDIKRLSEEMLRIQAENGFKFFLRDADNILQAEAVVLIGTRELCHGMNCMRCGFALCADRPKGVPCAINTLDVGIAVGSACAMAADLRIDTRVMHSAGMAAMREGQPCHGLQNVLAIPLSSKSKNPFFDRKRKESITFRNATAEDALFIARGFHMAMLYDDASEEQISNFARNICVREDVLYSWRNTIIAEVDGKCAGMLTAYDGRYYHDMRIRTMTLVKQHLGVEFPGMEDEAVAGEYYLDSLAVMPEYRGKGIGRKLLQCGIENGKALNLNVTLAVDPINDRAKRLYNALGFIPSGALFIFGHDYEKMIITAKTK